LKQIFWLFFFYSNVINKMLKIGWMEIPSLIENGVSQANFGYLVGVSSFGDELSTWKLVVVGLIDTAVPLGLAGPTPFAPSTCVPSCKHPSQKFCRGGYVVPLGSAVSPKISKTVFLCLVYLLIHALLAI
jgi:hypothetical protein